MDVTIYHNPRCAKSREALALIEDRGIKPRIVEYLKTPPDKKTLKDLLARLGMSPRQLLRTKEKIYQELGLEDAELRDDKLIAAMVEHPILIERPIVVSGKKAVVGRPPERVLEVV